MADDLKLQVVIEALLNAQGFEDAKARLTELAGAADKAGDQAETAGKQQKGYSDSLGGTRGPAADLTRILLQQVGVTGAAGEAAKAAGTAMYFLEGAASASAVAITGGIAVIALLLPKIIQWIGLSKEQNKEQEDLLANLKEMAPLLERYAKSVGTMTEAATLQLMAERGRRLREEREELRKIEEEIARLEPLLRQAFEAGMKGQKLTDSYSLQAGRLLELKARADDLRKAQNQNITVEKMYREEIDDWTASSDKKTEKIKKQTLAQRTAAQQEIDALIDIVDVTKKASTAKQKAQDEEVKRILAYRRLQREIEADEAALAEQKKLNALNAVGYAAMALDALSSLFRGNKALAIAAAIADTYAGAALALRTIPPPAGWAAAAATIAQGLAAVANIRKAEPTGFDDPFSDLTARRLGRRSAVDFVANFGHGFQSGMSSAMMGGNSYNTTINRGTTIQGGISVSGFMGAGKTEFMKMLSRELENIDRRVEKRTRIGT